MNNINEIKEMLDKLNEELETLRTENAELKLRIEKYEPIAENDTNRPIDMLGNLSKEELYELGESIINHTAKDEVQAITQLLYCWDNNSTCSKIPGEVTRMVITSQHLSEKNVEFICKFIVSTIKDRYTSRLGRLKEIPSKYLKMMYCLLEDGNLSNEWYEMLLDDAFEHTRAREGWGKSWATLFAKSSRYNVEKSPYYRQKWNVEKKS